MDNLPPRVRNKPKVSPAPAEPPVGTVGTSKQSQHAAESLDTAARYDVPHDLKWTQTKTMRMTDDHVKLLNELKFRHGLKIQEAVWYAIEQTYGNK